MYSREAVLRGMEMGHKANILELSVAPRDGGLYVTSPRIPGLHVFGKDPDEVASALKAAAEHLLDHNEGLRVEAFVGATGPDNDPAHVDAATALMRGDATLVLVRK